MHYYLEGGNLGEYTINAELSRMNFQLQYEGRVITCKDEIISVYEKIPMHDLWRLANQSIYSEILSILQRTFVDPTLSIRVVSTFSKFIIDFDAGTITAESTFEFLTVQDPTFRPSRGTPSDRLVLGSVNTIVFVDITNKKAKQKVDLPLIRMIFDDELRASAKCILSFRMDESNLNKNETAETLSQTKQKATALLNHATKAGSKALESVVGSIGRFMGADSPRENSLYRNDQLEHTSSDYNTDPEVISFADFMKDEDDESLNSNEMTKNGNGGWLSSAAEGFVGTLGRLLGADEANNTDRGDRSRNLFVRDDS